MTNATKSIDELTSTEVNTIVNCLAEKFFEDRGYKVISKERNNFYRIDDHGEEATVKVTSKKITRRLTKAAEERERKTGRRQDICAIKLEDSNRASLHYILGLSAL